MRNFDYVVAGRIEDAFGSDGTTTMPIAGGTELLNWFRLGIAAPERIVDLARIDGLDGIERTGDRLSIGALATLNQIGEEALVGNSSTVLDGAKIGARSMIAAGSLVTPGTDIPEGVLAMGAPCKVRGPLAGTPAERWVQMNPAGYQALAQRHRTGARPV